jgi:hypothetical protein
MVYGFVTYHWLLEESPRTIPFGQRLNFLNFFLRLMLGKTSTRVNNASSLVIKKGLLQQSISKRFFRRFSNHLGALKYRNTYIELKHRLLRPRAKFYLDFLTA